MFCCNIAPRAFGVVGDGITDNAEALMAMRDFMLRDINIRYVIDFEPGTYQYSNNRWLRGLHHIQVNGNGAKFQCISTKPSGRDRRPLLFTSVNQNYDDTDYPGINVAYYPGYRIASAEINDQLLQLILPSDAQFFQPGEWLWVNGFTQQWTTQVGNPRYFEYHQIKAADSLTGTVELTKPLRFRYSDQWQEVTDGVREAGLPRAVPLHRAESTIMKNLLIRDVEFLENSNDVPDIEAPVIFLGLKVTLENIKAQRLVPADSKSFYVNGGDFNSIEIDKHLSYVNIQNSDVLLQIKAATGCHDVRLSHNRIGSICRVGPIHSLVVDNCTIANNEDLPLGAAVQQYANVTTTRYVRIENTKTENVRETYRSGAPVQLIVSEVNSNEDILLDDTEDNRQHMQRIQIGTKLYLDPDLQALSGKVVDITWSGLQHVLSGDFSATVGQDFYYDPWHLVRTSGIWFNGEMSE